MAFSIIAGDRKIDLSVPVCMGIINATPDSFSDGSDLRKNSSEQFRIDIDKSLYRAEAMVQAGATFIDVGGESTRPGAINVSTHTELDRVIPVIQSIRSNLDCCCSIWAARASHDARLSSSTTVLSIPRLSWFR